MSVALNYYIFGQSVSMGTSISRMQFLRGGRQPIRPPWGPAEARFVEHCDRCGDCVAVCPEKVLVKGWGGYPEVDFSHSGCSFCGDCLTACKGRVLRGDLEDHLSAWNLKAQITDSCISLKGVVCRSCGEACEESAIRFRLEVGGIGRPLLNPLRCSGCGECNAICPVQAVRMLPGTGEPLEQAV